ncbi:MAG: hypothetical protein LC803_21460 [Acidobacteria bacterium]|nr:hypothetical protein [Acidobacteriota bacterium]
MGEGSVTIHGTSLQVGDGAAVGAEMSPADSAGEDSEIMLFDLSWLWRNMSETNMGEPVPETVLRRMRELRLSLLRLHKALLDAEREVYERVHGQVTGGELLQLVINHEQFVWLRPVSELIVRIDEMLDVDEPATADDAETLLAGARSLLTPSEAGGGFGQKYFAAIQQTPDVVLAHREVTRLLPADS